MRIRHALFALFTGFILTSCGGGGGESTPTISYTGVTTAALITPANADEMVDMTLDASGKAAATGIALGVVTEGPSPVSSPVNLAIPKSLVETVRRIDVTAANLLPGASFSGEVSCDNDVGSFAVTSTYNETTGALNGSIRFKGCLSDDAILNGRIGVSGRVDTVTFETVEATMTFKALTVTDGLESFTMGGVIEYSVSGQTLTITSNLKVRNNATDAVVWLENYEVVATDNVSEAVVTLSGRVYAPDYGYGVVTTTQPLRIDYFDDWPYSGQFVISGSNSGLRVTCISSTQYTLEVDEDGDGIYEFVSTETWN